MEVDDDFGFQPSSKMNPEDDYNCALEEKPKSAGKRSKQSAKSTSAAEEDLGVWGNLEKPFVGFKMASMTLKKILKHTPERLDNIDHNEEMKEEGGDQKPKWVNQADNDEVMSDGDEESKAELEQKSIRIATELTELQELLDFISLYKDAVTFFDVNGSRAIYTKFREENSRERILHSVVHFFISLHLPSAAPLPGINEPCPGLKRSNLKKTVQGQEYKARLQEVAGTTGKNLRSNLKTSMNGDDRPRTKEEIAKLLAWWDKEMEIEDPVGKDNGKETPSDKALLKMAFGDKPIDPSDFNKTARGYLKGQIKGTSGRALVKTSEYSFFKKKVRLNVVEKKVHTFKLDKEEVDQKRAKKRTGSRKNQ